MTQDNVRHAIKKMACSKNISPKVFQYMHIEKQDACNIQQMMMLLFNTILLKGVITTSLMNKTMISTKGIHYKLNIFYCIIRVWNLNELTKWNKYFFMNLDKI